MYRLRRFVWCLVVAACSWPAYAQQPGLSAETSETADKADKADKTDGSSEPAWPSWPTEVKLRGRIEADAILAAQSALSKELIGNLQNGYGLRRARLGAQGKFDTSARWVAEFDFAGGDVRLADVYAGLLVFPGIDEVRVGYFREPFSLDGATSSNFFSFLERSPLNMLDPARNWGFAGYWHSDDQRVYFAVGGFRDGTSNGGLSLGDGGNWAVTTRAVVLPLYEDKGKEGLRLLHLGGAFSYRVPLDGVVAYGVEPQSSLLHLQDSPPSRFLPAFEVAASSEQLYDLQAALVWDSISLQGEWIATAIQQVGGGVVFLHGFYVFGSYFLTGEHRGYNRGNAAFDRVHVLNPVFKTKEHKTVGCGAIELVTRLAIADYASGNIPPPPDSEGRPQGGTILYQATFGVNWYLNDHTRIMGDYTLAVPSLSGAADVPVHVFGVRTAIFW